MKKVISLLAVIAILISSFAFSASALDASKANSDLAMARAATLGVPGDADGSGGKLTASDARMVLRYSAGLDDGVKNIFAVDVDSDGIITAIDARLILRASAGLEDMETLRKAVYLNYFNASINSVKPNGYEFYKSNIEHTDDIYFKDSSAIDALMDDIEDILTNPLFQNDLTDEQKAEMRGLKASLTKDKGKTDYSNNSSYASARPYTAGNDSFPISENEIASFLMIDDIAGIEYKTGADFKYENYRYGSVTGSHSVNKTVDLQNLDAITVYINTDSLKTVPRDSVSVSNGKIFDIFTQKDVDALLDGDDLLDDLMDMDGLPGSTISLKTSLDELKYENSSVTLYMDPENGVPVAASYNLHYDFTVRSDLVFKILDLGIFGSLIDVDGKFIITTSITSTTDYYFEDNAKAGNNLIG